MHPNSQHLGTNPLSRPQHGRWRGRFGIWFLAAALTSLASSARADLMLYPTRIVLEKNQRAAQIELINQGKTSETYRINLVNRRMGETGEFISIDTPGPGELFADPLLRYSPRQVTILPGKSQTVRILLRKPADLAAGEYRSHLQFERVADSAESNSVDGVAKPGEGQVGISMTALIGATIPVIVRHGDTQVKVTMTDLKIVPPSADSPDPTLDVHINRDGNRSVFGDLTVTYTPPGGAPVEVAKAGGAAVYVPNPLRRARLALRLPPGAALKGGTLNVVYRERQESGGKMMAEASMKVP